MSGPERRVAPEALPRQQQLFAAPSGAHGQSDPSVVGAAEELRSQPGLLASTLNGNSHSLLLRPNDVAKLLCVSRAWVYEAARTGRIPSVRLGGEDGPLRFVAADIEQWLDDARAAWLPSQRGA